jgi:hypothetical protein
MRRITLALLLTLTTGTFAALATPISAAAGTCAEDYYLCLNNHVYDGDGGTDDVESIECGARYAACLFHLF